MKKVTIYTDGACSGNPGAGGWGAILKYGSHEKEISGFEEETTNNRMELMAAIKALEALKEPCEVDLYSDSTYLVDAFNMKWVDRWKLNGWVNAKKERVKNMELWKRLDELSSTHRINWIKVKGHSDNEYNNRCDKLATGEIKKHMPGMDNTIETEQAKTKKQT
jgi:ribonuclease HI